MIKHLSDLVKSLPTSVIQLLIKSLILFIVWKLSYEIYLKPNRILDKPLTNSIAFSVIKILRYQFPESKFEIKQEYKKAAIMYNGKRALGVGDNCNGLELIILYISFIIIMPTSGSRMTFFLIGGTLGILIINIIRVGMLSILSIKNSVYTDFAHHFLFKLIVYAAIFGMWLLYKREKNEN